MVLLLLATQQVFAQGSNAFSSSFTGAEGVENIGQNAVLAFKQAGAQADAMYEEGSYGYAFPRYQNMAKYGDKYSQFRLAVMYELGRGVDKDLVQAFAWSYVAAETGYKEFKDYHKMVRAQMTPEQINSAKQITRDYQIDYGMFAAADNANTIISRTLKSCTGSKVGSRCDRVSANGFSCSLNNFGIPDKNCIQLGMLGIPAVQGMMPLDLKIARSNLVKLKEAYNPGRTEYRELRLINE
jgi:hypothetical protein